MMENKDCSKVELDYNNQYNYEYMIRHHISKHIPIFITDEDWYSAQMYHYSGEGKKFDINIKIEENEGKYEIVFTSQDNKLILPVKTLRKQINIDSAVKNIHEAMINIPITRKNHVFSKQYIDALYNSSIQVGICKWLQSFFRGTNEKEKDGSLDKILDDRGVLFYDILKKYDDWSTKTYEGRFVSFGIMIEIADQSKITSSIKVLDILNNNDFAPVVEVPSSLVKINYKGEVIDYCSNLQVDNNKKYNYYFHPLQLREYLKICRSNLSNDKSKYICLLLTANSEIAILENDKLIWLKKNNCWQNFEYTYFFNIMNGCLPELKESAIKKIYYNILNTTFAKTGGCISIIDSKNLEDFTKKFIISNWFDYIPNSIEDEKNLDDYINSLEEEKKKSYDNKIKKKEIIINLLKKKSFFDIDSRLLLELISMDGATIIDIEGNIMAVSSIVDLLDRASGGGRSAATKSLSSYGVSIKISTDGYFEIYHKKIMVYSNKK